MRKWQFKQYTDKKPSIIIIQDYALHYTYIECHLHEHRKDDSHFSSDIHFLLNAKYRYHSICNEYLVECINNTSIPSEFNQNTFPCPNEYVRPF